MKHNDKALDTWPRFEFEIGGLWTIRPLTIVAKARGGQEADWADFVAPVPSHVCPVAPGGKYLVVIRDVVCRNHVIAVYSVPVGIHVEPLTAV